MVAVGIAAGGAAGVGSFNVILSYIATGCVFTLLAALTFAFFEVAKLARVRADKPVPIVLGLLRQRAPLVVLPTLLWPLMLAAYTTAKMAIPFLVGYSWDAFWADADRLIIRGGSAGGYTTLAALTFHDTFKSGASYYGISDLEVLAQD